MSTKTTFKRIALVAVAALGLGVLTSVNPASATTTTGFSLNTSSMTLVDTSGSNAGYVVYEVTLSDLAGASTPLQSTESLLAEVVSTTVPKAVDTTTATSDIILAWGNNTYNSVTGASAASATAGAKTFASTTASDYENLNVATRGASSTSVADSTLNTATAVLKVGTASGKAIDKGTYEIRISLYDNATPANGNRISSSVVKFTAVSTRDNSGAVLTAANVGLKSAGAKIGETSTNYLSATLADANAGLVRTGSNAEPTITATLVTGTTTLTDVTAAGLTGFDDGAVTADASDRKNANELGTSLDGVYGFSGTLGTPTTATGTFRVRFGAATSTATVTFAPAVAAIHTHAAPSVTATGLAISSAAPTWYVPTTAKTASLSVFTGTSATAALTNYPVTFTVTWTNGAAGDVTPQAATPTVVYSDASGYATLNLTNNSPVNGAIASVAISGYSTTQPATQTINWVSSGRQVTISASPASQRVAVGGSTVVTVTVSDRFGARVPNVVLQPSLTSTSANYSTTAMPTVTTNASGQATVTLAAGANDTSDSITFTDVAGIAAASTARAYTYKTTVDTIASFLSYYDLNESASTISTPVPSTGITQADGTYLSITKARDNSRTIALTTSTTNDAIIIRAQALTSASAGANARPVVATGSAGVWFRGSSAPYAASTSATLITDSSGFVSVVVGSNKTGANTVTLTAGTVTTTIAFWTTNAAADARYVTLTGAATATANADPIPFTATVTDRYGNPVSNVTLSIQASGVGVMGGGSTLQTFTTNSTGTFTFTGTSLNTAGGSATFTASASSTGEFASAAGFSSSTPIDSTVTAGNASSSVVVTFAAGENAAAANAQAATDAAAEATDAANAATDAANAAAEAADAATAAAQDAADAVAALSTQVSEMVNALKKQITALTNLVIKIQKKVKA